MSHDDNNQDGQEEIRKGPLLPFEITNLRHMINDYFYRKKIKKMLRVWVYTIGTAATATIGVMTVWREILSRLMK